MNRHERDLLAVWLATPAAPEVRTAMAAAHRPADVLRRLGLALAAAQWELTIDIGNGEVLDCTEPLDTGWSDGLNDHDRVVLAAFIEALERRMAHGDTPIAG